MATVWVRTESGKNGLFVDESAMVEMELRDGQEVAQGQMFDVIAANARAFCRKMDARKSQGEDAPDTSELASLCGHRETDT